MKGLRSFLFINAVLIAVISSAQNNKTALKHYNDAVKALQLNDYQKALDLLDRSIDIVETSDSYVNRAICKLKLGDQDGYCEDLRRAYLLIDQNAYSAYWRDCGRVDTSFVDSVGRRCARSAAEYTRVVRTPFVTAYDQEMELFNAEHKCVCKASISDSDTLYNEGTLIDAPIWIDREIWMRSLFNTLDGYLNSFQIHLNVNADGTSGAMTILGMSKEGKYRVERYAERNPPKFEPATLWGKPIDLRVKQKINAD